MTFRKQINKTPDWGERWAAHLRQLKLVIKELYSLTKTVRSYGFFIMTYYGAPQLLDSVSRLFQ
jgi:hypothetical protein